MLAWLLQTHGDRERLHHGQHDRQVAGVLVKGLAAGFAAFLLQLLPRRIHRAHQLHDDRGADVGHHVQREDGHALHGAAREHVEHAQDALRLLRERGGEGFRIDPRIGT
jgi:hypothetical protein